MLCFRTTLRLTRNLSKPTLSGAAFESDPALPLAITRAASQQTFYTIRYLVDPGQALNAYRAYAYFRWVDDWLDREHADPAECLAFVERQQALIDDSYQGIFWSDVYAEERLLVDLIRANPAPDSGLAAYIRHLIAVMDFDARRRGQLITQAELDQYSRHLAIAVTEALHYFIGHDRYAPHSEARYLAVTAAHITHMLRDTGEDIAAGYFNVPADLLERHHLTPSDFGSAPYQAWVKSRVQLARDYFQAGRAYLAQVECRRCRFAGYAYMARFQGVLDTIERENYCLRSGYHTGLLNAGWSACRMVVGDFLPYPLVQPTA